MECHVDKDLQPAWLWGALWLSLNTHTGLLHFLVLNWTPTPQEREHSLRSLHLLQPPWTGFIVGLGRGMVVSRSSTETHLPRRHHCKDSNTLCFFFLLFLIHIKKEYNIYLCYWPSVRSRWLDIGFCIFMGRETRKRNKQTSNIKEQKSIDQTLGLVIKRISYMVKTKFLLAEQSGLIRVLTGSCVLGYT